MPPEVEIPANDPKNHQQGDRSSDNVWYRRNHPCRGFDIDEDYFGNQGRVRNEAEHKVSLREFEIEHVS